MRLQQWLSSGNLKIDEILAAEVCVSRLDNVFGDRRSRQILNQAEAASADSGAAWLLVF